MENSKTIFTLEDVKRQSLEYFNGDELAAHIWINKYALKDAEGNIYENSPVAMHHRLARELSRIENKYPNPISEDKIFSLLDHFRYIIPAGSPMMGIGNDFQLASLSNCFVVGISGDADSYGAIMKIDEEVVQLMKRRGGVGHDLSQLRPKGAHIENSAMVSTGIVPMMERFSASANEVVQKGRRGALMLSVSARHPDAEDFVDAKLTDGRLACANISVRVDDKFMNAVQCDGMYQQQFPTESDAPLIVKEINAHGLWNKIVHNAWQSAEPGILFWDTIIRESIPDCYADKGFATVSTNPCGEIPMCPYDSCRLLALNLFSYVVNPFTPQSRFNFELFRQHVVIAQRLLDDIVDLELEKIQKILDKIDSDPQDDAIKCTERQLWNKIYEKCAQGRRTGLGITAEGDMLAAMGLQYGSDEAIGFAVNVHRTLALAAYRSSVVMAKERGAFDFYDSAKEVNNPFIMRIREVDAALYQEMKQYGRRNIALLTIAPTGTISIMTQTSSGIEPAFKVIYRRRRKVNPTDPESRVSFVDENGEAYEEYIVYHHNFVLWMKQNGYDVERQYTEEELNDIVTHSPYAKSVSDDVDWIRKVRMQGAIQKWVDHSISVTVNMPENVSEDMVNDVFMEAWKSGCKGCTIYREGSRTDMLLSVTQKDGHNNHSLITETRPQILDCDVVRFQNNKDKWVAFVGLLDGYPYEIFTGIQDDDEGIMLPKSVMKGRIIRNVNRDGTKRYDFQFENKRGYKTTVEGLSEKFNKEYWNYAKLISGVLRYRMPLDRVVKLVGSLQLEDENINTWKTGVERALKKYVKDGAKAGGICPVCGQETLVYQEGCATCQNCGSSVCG